MTLKTLEHTLDFFHHGMSTLVHPGDRVMILLPGGGVGPLSPVASNLTE